MISDRTIEIQRNAATYALYMSIYTGCVPRHLYLLLIKKNRNVNKVVTVFRALNSPMN